MRERKSKRGRDREKERERECGGMGEEGLQAERQGGRRVEKSDVPEGTDRQQTDSTHWLVPV